MSRQVHSQAKWEKIKKEYMAGGTSMRDLARKYGVAVATISERCKKDGWNEAKKKIAELTEQKVVERISDERANNAELAEQILNKLMQKISLAVEVINPTDVSATKQLTQCMKDLADMGVYKVENKDSNIEIGFAEVDEYAD